MTFTLSISPFWTIFCAVIVAGLTWAFWPRQSERGRGGAYSFPDIFSPLLRLTAVLLAMLVMALWKAIVS